MIVEMRQRNWCRQNSPGLPSANLNGCGGFATPQGCAIWAWEMDSEAGLKDDFGMRFSSPASLPYGFAMGTSSSLTHRFFYSSPRTPSAQKSL